MSDGPRRLDELPSEILHRIALHLPCSAILRVCFTNRALYSACYDRLVFKRCAIGPIFEPRYNHYPELDDVPMEDWELESCPSEASDENSEDEEWFELFEEELSPEDDWDMNDWGPNAAQVVAQRQQDWYAQWGESVFDALSAGDSARIAFAVQLAERYFNVSKAHHMVQNTTNQTFQRTIEPPECWVRYREDRSCWSPRISHAQWKAGDFLRWFPHLLALRHPSSLSVLPESLHCLLWEPDIYNLIEKEDYTGVDPNPSTPDFCAVSFCLMTLMLLRMEKRRRMPTDPDDHNDFLTDPFWNRGLHNYDPLIELGVLLRKESLLRDYDLSRYGMAIVLYMLFYVVGPRDYKAAIPVPTLQLVSTKSFGEIVPWVTPAEDTVKWCGGVKELVHWMRGEWTGWSMRISGWDAVEVKPYVRTCRFILGEPMTKDFVEAGDSPTCPDTIAIIEPTSSWVDNSGTFTLSGHINSDGQLWFTQTEVMPLNLASMSTFRGIFTPYGIAGIWQHERNYSPHIHHLNGFFWLWKKEWCGDT